MSKVLERFLRYVRIETTSLEDVEKTPSSECQFDLANLLREELRELGVEAIVDEHSYVFACIPATIEKTPTGEPIPVIGLIAHLDTAPGISGKDVNPQVIEYVGGPITLANGTVIPDDEALKSCIGHRIVTGDGTTLLGADDKAGIAAIMEMIERLISENVPHGELKIAFTPDEEIGNGTAFFDVERFGAKFAYTIDGELPGELNKETFTAELAIITVAGRDIHPGQAKGIMINSVRVLGDIVSMLPKERAPETTEGREPFIHPMDVRASISEGSVKCLLRGFDDADFTVHHEILENIVETVKKNYSEVEIDIRYRSQYRNMAEKLRECPEVLDKLELAAKRAGVVPYWKPVRGGTDGSRLTEMGLPCPNIYGGGHNFHSYTEWLSLKHLETTVNTLVHLVKAWTE